MIKIRKIALFLSLSLSLQATTRSVTTNAGDLSTGSLLYWILNADPGDVIDCTNLVSMGMGTITLAQPMPAVTQSTLTITGGSGGPATIAGSASHFQAFSVASGTITIQNFNVSATGSQGGQGGTGIGGGGGGGAGGGGLYVHNGANVTISALNFTTNQAVGGNGGAGVAAVGGGGGAGGFGGNGAPLGTGTNSGGNGAASGGGGGGGGNTLGANGGDAGGAVPATPAAGYFSGGGGGGAGISGGSTNAGDPPVLRTGGAASGGNGGGGAGAGGTGNAATGTAGGSGGTGIGGDTFFAGGGGGGAGTTNDGGAGLGTGGGGGSGVAGGNGGAGGTAGGGGGGAFATGGAGGFGSGGGGGTAGGASVFGGGTGASGTPASGGGGAALGGAIFIQDGGVLTIRDNTAYNGNTVTAGTGGLNDAVALSPDIFIRSSGSLTFNLLTTDLTIPTSIDSDETAGGGTGGGIALSGSRTLTLSAGTNTFSGTLTIQSGTLNAAGDGSLGSLSPTPVNVVIGSGTLQAGGPINSPSTRLYSLTGNSTFDTQASTISLAGVVSGSGSLTKIGTGTMTLSGANTYSGGTTLSAGTLIITSDGNLGSASGSVSIGAATLQTNAPGIVSARAFTLTGAATINTNTQTDTISGAIGGSGSLTVSGGGTLILTGTNSYSGGTTITGSTLQGTISALQGNIQDNGNLIFNDSSSGTYSGILMGAGTLQQTGSGTLTISGSSPAFTGTTSVNTGGLIVNGSLSASPVNVANTMVTGLLGGAGTVGSVTVSNQGQLAPGSGGVGTLSINGTLSLGGMTATSVNISPASNTAIAATGTASLNGALTVNPSSGFYGAQQTYTILTSAGLGGSQFTSFSSTNSNFIPSVTYTLTDVLLTVDIVEPFLFFPFSNPNTRSVGKNIDALNSSNVITPGLEAVIDSFAGGSFAAINSALDQMHPAQIGAFPDLQATIGGQLISLFHRKPYVPCNCSRSSRVWMEPFGGNLEEPHRGFQIGFTANTGGIALGIDKEFTENWVVGIGGAWNDTLLEWHHSRGSARINGFYGSIYTDYQVENCYFGGSVLAGLDFYDAHRHMEFFTTNETAGSDFHALDVIGQFTTAYFFGTPTAHIYPYATVDYMYLNAQSFHEASAGALNLSVRSNTNSTLRTEAGMAMQVQDKNGDETFCISPLVAFGWVMLCPLQRDRYIASFQDEPIPFSVIGRRNTWQLISVDFNLSFYYKCFSFGFEYNALSSVNPHKGGYFDQNGSAHFEIKW